jgi:hypothetical protein
MAKSSHELPQWHNFDMIVVTRHLVPQKDLAKWLASAKLAIAPLAKMPGCKSIVVGLATDQVDLVSVVSTWDGVGSYRRALSNFDVKMTSIPFLSTAIDEPSAFEVVLSQQGEDVQEFEPGRAFDADEIGLGDAAAENVRHRAE